MSFTVKKCLSSLRDELSRMFTWRLFHRRVVELEGKKEFRYNSVRHRGMSLSYGLCLWYGLVVEIRGGRGLVDNLDKCC